MMLLFYLCLIAIIGSITWYSWRYGITPTSTSSKVKDKLLQILPTEFKGEIVELGSGWGTLAFALARYFPENQVKAYEISPVPYIISKLISKLFLFSNLQIERRDFYDISLKNVSLVVCYLYPGAMNRLKIKFENELSSETYILSHTFAIPGWIPIRFVCANDMYQTPIYLYQISSSR